MPKTLPDGTDLARQMSAREEGVGFDTEVARFFGAEVNSDEDEVPTLIDSADLGRTARTRSRERSRQTRRPNGLTS